MPPSGFDHHNVNALTQFLRTLTSALCHEALHKKKIPFHQAVLEEIRNIDRDQQLNKRSPMATATLQLIRGYYDKLSKHMSPTADTQAFLASANKVQAELEEEILKIKVLETA